MRLRGPFAAIGILGLAVLAVSVIAVWTSVSHARPFRAMVVTTATRVDGTENVFAPPPFGATPAMSSKQACPPFFSPSGADKEAPGATVHLDLLTSPIAPSSVLS